VTTIAITGAAVCVGTGVRGGTTFAVGAGDTVGAMTVSVKEIASETLPTSLTALNDSVCSPPSIQ
jgi:hypothetical protein